MKKNQTLKYQVFYFKNWSKKPFAVFRSLGIIIHIGVLLVIYNLISLPLKAQINNELSIKTDTLPEVNIVSSEPATIMSLKGVPVTNTEPEQTCAQHIGELPASLPGTNVRQRGIHGVQGDVSIRGSSPGQVQILLNGIPVNDPQTGHHNLNLPVPLISISTLQKHTPATGQQLGTNAFSGSLNFINNISDTNTFQLRLAAAQYKLIDLSASADIITGKSKHHIAFDHSSSNGHTDNTDFCQLTAYMHSNLHINQALSADLQMGFTDNAFGAEGFYTDKYPKQYEEIETSFISASIRRAGKIRIKASIYYRHNSDRFELFRESIYKFNNGYFINEKDTAKYIPGIYESWNYYSGHNYHKTNVSGYQIYANSRTKYGKIKTGIHHRHELILSNVLGKTRFDNNDQKKTPYTHQAIRDHINTAITWESPESSGIIAGLTGLMHYTKTYGPLYYGGTRLQYRIKNNISIWAGANQNMRLPSFTDLYYDGPSNQGNPDLLPEKAINFELGFYGKFGIISLQNQMFYQIGNNMIDWVKPSSEDIFTTRNYTRLNSTGNEFSLEININKNTFLYPWIKHIYCHYTWIYKYKPEKDMISAYALDYLLHQATLSFNQQFTGIPLHFHWSVHFNNRAGTYTKNNNEYPYQPWFRTDIKISYKLKKLLFYVSAYNLFDNKIRDFGNITLPGCWISSGIIIKISEKQL